MQPARYLFILLATTSLGFIHNLTAQLYTVQIGMFQDVRLDDFQGLDHLGFIYANQVEDQVFQVFVGNYSDRNRAEQVVQQLHGRDFRNATLLQQPLDQGSEISVIQIASRRLGAELNWENMLKAGNLYVQSDDQQLRIVTGVYRSADHAKSDLERVRSLGYSDAFVRSVNNYRLVPVTDFETGIKQPLIPFELSEPSVAVADAPTGYGNRQPVIGESDPDVATRGGTINNSATIATNLPASPVASGLPAIRGNMKRESSTDLQKALKQLGFYAGNLDGYYGPGTTTAYHSAWNTHPTIRKYRRLSSELPDADFMSWPEMKVLQVAATELAAGQTDPQLAATGHSERARYFANPTAVTAAAATRSKAWHLTLWERLDAWAQQDPLHQQIVDGLRVAYTQSRVRLEDYFMERNLSSQQAKDLALVVLQAAVGAELQRFIQ